MTVAHILQSKSSEVVTLPPASTVLDVAEALASRNIGSVLITDEARRPLGIVSERDVVRVLAERGGDVSNLTAQDIMTRELFTCSPDDTLNEVMSVMTVNRVRHLPVMSSGKLSGIVSIGDVVKHRITEIEFEAAEMKRYISG